jgi:hypothetical protein
VDPNRGTELKEFYENYLQKGSGRPFAPDEMEEYISVDIF